MTTSNELPSSLGFLTDPEYTVGGVRFFIDVIPARPAVPIFRAILHELQHVDLAALADSIGESGEQDDGLGRVGMLLLHELTRIRPGFIDWLEEQMFRHVRFQSSSTSPQALAGAEDMAFSDLTVYDVHEVLIRSIARNFFGQFSVYRSRRGGAQAAGAGQP